MELRKQLAGESSFYSRDEYLQDTHKDLRKPLSEIESVYRHETEHKVWRLAKAIFSVIIFPIGLYQLLHRVIGYIILPSSLVAGCFLPRMFNRAVSLREEISSDRIDKAKFKLKRIAIEVDGYIVDAIIMGKASTLGNDRWVLKSNGNAELYEESIYTAENYFKTLVDKLEANALIFNYPGVGESTGSPSRTSMVKAYRAMLHFLEDQKGLGAKEIIAYGHSIGGAVQGEALDSHQLKSEIKYLFIKSRTFSDLSTIASYMIPIPFVSSLIKLMGWNMSSVHSSKKLERPEIILQTANKVEFIHDGIVSAEASLARRLISDADYADENKLILGISENHNCGLYPNTMDFLVKNIQRLLEPDQE